MEALVEWAIQQKSLLSLIHIKYYGLIYGYGLESNDTIDGINLPILSLSRSCCLTADSISSSSSSSSSLLLQNTIKKWETTILQHPLSAALKVILALAYERTLSTESFYFPYINTLPTNFPICLLTSSTAIFGSITTMDSTNIHILQQNREKDDPRLEEELQGTLLFSRYTKERDEVYTHLYWLAEQLAIQGINLSFPNTRDDSLPPITASSNNTNDTGRNPSDKYYSPTTVTASFLAILTQGNYSNLVWAYSCYISRALYIPCAVIPQHLKHSGTMQTLEQYFEPAMVPIIDLCNHQSGTLASIELSHTTNSNNNNNKENHHPYPKETTDTLLKDIVRLRSLFSLQMMNADSNNRSNTTGTTIVTDAIASSLSSSTVRNISSPKRIKTTLFGKPVNSRMISAVNGTEENNTPNDTNSIISRSSSNNDVRNNRSSITMDFSSLFLQLRVYKTIPPNTPIYINYGSKTNSSFLLYYGFTLPYNPMDTVSVYLIPPPYSTDTWNMEEYKLQPVLEYSIPYYLNTTTASIPMNEYILQEHSVPISLFTSLLQVISNGPSISLSSSSSVEEKNNIISSAVSFSPSIVSLKGNIAIWDIDENLYTFLQDNSTTLSEKLPIIQWFLRQIEQLQKHFNCSRKHSSEEQSDKVPVSSIASSNDAILSLNYNNPYVIFVHIYKENIVRMLEELKRLIELTIVYYLHEIDQYNCG